MKIRITKETDHFRADCCDLPGTPPVGEGDTPEKAVAILFCRLMVEDKNKVVWRPIILRALEKNPRLEII